MTRLKTSLALLALVAAGLVVFASPASAHCSGHTPHPDRYSSGGIHFGNGTAIRTHPHTNCTRKGLGYPNHGIDVHCWKRIGSDLDNIWVYLRNTTTGVNGWSHINALDLSRAVGLPSCY